ncbi:MAG: hypothetical protein JWN16_1524 [Alphaproteobacteria bacterium]|nr:hypothetical protein [Alphaproteobacteria bacterium]
MSVCAVIPAAGRGTRLGGNGPKILTPLTDSRTIWSVLYDRLTPLVNHIHLVLSPEGASVFPALPANVSTSIQPAPTGMGDAIFRGYDIWSRHDAVLVVWGDQVFVSADTLSRSLAALVPGRNAVLPVTRMTAPYVEYVFSGAALTKVLQTREGDVTRPGGFSDVGTFALGTDGLKPAWEAYRATSPRGGATGEINFLPFLPFLATQGWRITPLEVADATEARGINTPDDLAFFRSLYKTAP